MHTSKVALGKRRTIGPFKQRSNGKIMYKIMLEILREGPQKSTKDAVNFNNSFLYIV